MTATLAAELDTRAANMVKVRAEYEHTKADHARVDGCGVCPTPFVEGRSIGWEYLPDGTPTLCPPCVAEGKRYAAQMAAVAVRDVCSNGLHKLEGDNVYYASNGNGKKVVRCRPCYLKTSRAAKARARARDKAAS